MATRAAAAGAHVILFTRASCSLCDTAKVAVQQARKQRPFHYVEIDVLRSENSHWKDLYEYDTPVLHIQNSPNGSAIMNSLPASQKLFHRFTDKEILALLDHTEPNKQNS